MTLPHILRPALRNRIASICTLALVCVAVPALHAQAINTARRVNELSTFVATTGGTPDYFPGHAMGITAGADWTAHHGRFLATSLEVRGNRTSSNQLIERSITFGPRLQTNFGNNVHPYINYFIGGGTIVFVNGSTGYHEDRGPVHSLGGGVAIDLPHNFATRLDFQHQNWNLGRNYAAGPETVFQPNLVSVGVQYRIPFRPRMSRVR